MSGDFVYAIQRESGGPIKVGKATNIRKRLSQLQTAHHERLIVLREWRRLNFDGARVEQMAHSFLDEKRLGGEWFDVTLEEASKAVEKAIVWSDMPRGSRVFTIPAPVVKIGPTPEEVAWAKANPGDIAKEILKWYMEK